MMRVLSWVMSFLTVTFAFGGFWALAYIEVDSTLIGFMIALLSATMMWLLAALSLYITDCAQHAANHRRKKGKA